MQRAVTCNAFRVLSLPADAAMKDIYRQQQRLKNAIEIDEPESLRRFRFLKPISLGSEVLLEAVHRIEQHRLVEEIFWLHDLDGKIELNASDPGEVISSLRSEAKLNTVRGTVVRHNLAVILHCLALECSRDEVAFDYWHEALSLWSKILSDRIFWDFIQDRVDNDVATVRHYDPGELKARAKAVLLDGVRDRLWAAISANDLKSLARNAQLAKNHSSLLDTSQVIDQLANQFLEDGTTGFGRIADRLAAIAKDAPSGEKREILVGAESEIRKLHATTEALINALALEEVAKAWRDLKAIMMGRLSVAYFNLLDDMNESLRLIAEACKCAQDVNTKQRLESDWRYVQRQLLCSEALALMKKGDFALADQKLAGALALSTEEQKHEIQELQQTCGRARAFHGVDANKRSPTLHTINGIGATFYGRREFDSLTRTYTTNHWFVLLYLPIIPIASYRVSDAGAGTYQIYGRLPLSSFLRKWRLGILAAVAGLIIWANVDSGSSSSSPSSGINISPSYSSTPSNTASSPSSYTPSAGFHGNPTFGPAAENQAIEAERASLEEKKRSLHERKRQIDDERDALNSMESYMQSVRSTYTAENIPETVRVRYNATVDDYNSRVPAFNTSLESFNSDARAFQLRLDAFNAKVDRYNSTR